MNADDWQRINRIFTEAIARDPAERRQFIEDACGDNISLCKDILALVAAYERADSFLERGAGSGNSPQQHPSIEPGTRFGPYEILYRIGAGGIGEVYKAHDSRMGRDVAIKVLQRDVADGSSWERFQREVRAASALNHPNICTVHDIGETDGRPYLVMELLEGVTLGTHINDRPMESASVIAIALQI